MFEIIDKKSLKNIVDNYGIVKIPYKTCLDENFSEVNISARNSKYIIRTDHNIESFENFDDAYLCFKKYNINLGIVQKYIQNNNKSEDGWIKLKIMVKKLYKKLILENK